MMDSAKPADRGNLVDHGPELFGAVRQRVLHVGKFYPPHMGGIETHLQALCEDLGKHLDIKVVVANDTRKFTEELRDNVTVTRVPTWLTFASTPICPGMIAQIRASNPAIIHIHLPNPMAVLAYLISGHRGILVITYHSDTVRQRVLGALFNTFLHRALRRSAAIIATSPDYRRSSQTLAPYMDRCVVIPYGIELDHFVQADPERVAALRNQFGDRVVISVGRLVYYKGFEYLIRAMTQVEGRLLIVGDGPLRGKLEQLTRELRLDQKVIFAGEIQNREIVPYYHAAKVFALASVARSEAFGIVQIEAMAAGLPVVNTSLDSGVPFVSLHEQTGLTVPPRNPGALAGAINRLLNDANLRGKLGEAARSRAQQEFSLNVMTSRTLSLYSKVMHSRPHEQPNPHNVEIPAASTRS